MRPTGAQRKRKTQPNEGMKVTDLLFSQVTRNLSFYMMSPRGSIPVLVERVAINLLQEKLQQWLKFANDEMAL